MVNWKHRINISQHYPDDVDFLSIDEIHSLTRKVVDEINSFKEGLDHQIDIVLITDIEMVTCMFEDVYGVTDRDNAEYLFNEALNEFYDVGDHQNSIWIS